MAPISSSDAEWQVMNVIWEGQPMAAQDVVASLSQTSDWSAATIKTMLHRLTKKGVLQYEQQGNRYVYKSAVRRADCIRRESRSFLERVFDGQAAPAVAYLLQSAKLSPGEISQLRKLLDEQEAQS